MRPPFKVASFFYIHSIDGPLLKIGHTLLFCYPNVLPVGTSLISRSIILNYPNISSSLSATSRYIVGSTWIYVLSVICLSHNFIFFSSRKIFTRPPFFLKSNLNAHLPSLPFLLIHLATYRQYHR